MTKIFSVLGIYVFPNGASPLRRRRGRSFRVAATFVAP
jgi:hypothetical protein